MNVLSQATSIIAGNYFIRGIRLADFFSEQSQKQFNVLALQGILFLDAARDEYEADVYFWTKGRYLREPIDY